MFKRVLGLVFFVIGLTACGGGGTDPEGNAQSGGSNTAAPSLSLSELAGVYEGVVIQSGISDDVSGVISANGKIKFITAEGEQLSGQMTISGDVISINSFLSFNGDGTDTGVSYLSTLTDSGSATASFEDGVLTGDSIFGATNSKFVLTRFDELTDVGASIEQLGGNYVTVNFDSSFSVDADGVLTGSDDDGCQYLGNITIENPQVNVYEMNLEVSNCGIAGTTFTGLGVYIPAPSNDLTDIFLIQIDNGNLALLSELYRN